MDEEQVDKMGTYYNASEPAEELSLYWPSLHVSGNTISVLCMFVLVENNHSVIYASIQLS